MISQLLLVPFSSGLVSWKGQMKTFNFSRIHLCPKGNGFAAILKNGGLDGILCIYTVMPMISQILLVSFSSGLSFWKGKMKTFAFLIFTYALKVTVSPPF